jgi:hypothetical protein
MTTQSGESTKQDLLNFILKCDSLIVTLTIQLPAIIQEWRIASTIFVIHSIIPFSISWTARKVNRSANFCAHHVTNRATTCKMFSSCILIIFPLSNSFPLCIEKDFPSSLNL